MNSNNGCNIWYILIGLLFLISGMIQSNNIYAIIIAALLLISIIGAFIYLTITRHKKIDQKDFYISEQKESEDINITESDKQACLLFSRTLIPQKDIQMNKSIIISGLQKKTYSLMKIHLS